MNTKVFQTRAARVPDTKNNAGGNAYKMEDKEAAAQLAVTGCFNDTFYVKAQDQLDNLLEIVRRCDDEYVRKLAIYTRHHGYMKDSPAVLTAYLFGKNSDEFEACFNGCIDNVKMLSNFVQCVRSGQFGRTSLGSRGKRVIQNWLKDRDLDYLFRQSIAKNPSLGDIIQLSHPNPGNDLERRALYGMLTDNQYVAGDLPQIVTQFNAFKNSLSDESSDIIAEIPNVPFNMLDSLPLTDEHWKDIFRNGQYQFTRMNLNTALRHNVFNDPEMVELIANRLRDEDMIVKARQFPYQFLAAYNAASNNVDMPRQIIDALHDAMEVACRHVPALEGDVYIAVDCSGSMNWAVTGGGYGYTSSIRYCDVASLFASAMFKSCPNAKLMTFSSNAVFVNADARDTTMTIANKLSSAGGGTDVSAPLRKLNAEKRNVDTFILISDDESWVDRAYQSTGTVKAWADLKKRCPNAKQVRINISPNATDQLPKRSDTLRVGGFSDAVFTAIENFGNSRDWVSTIENSVV